LGIIGSLFLRTKQDKLFFKKGEKMLERIPKGQSNKDNQKKQFLELDIKGQIQHLR